MQRYTVNIYSLTQKRGTKRIYYFLLAKVQSLMVVEVTFILNLYKRVILSTIQRRYFYDNSLMILKKEIR